MSRQFWEEMVAWMTTDATPVANTVTETIATPDIVMLANYLNSGRTVIFEAFGKLSTTGAPTLKFGFRWGGVAGTLLAATEMMTMGSGVTNLSWSVEARIQTRVDGASGSLLVFGRAIVHTSTTAVIVSVFSVAGVAAPAAVTVDLTADKALSFTATWGTASASNTLTAMQRYVRVPN